MPAVLSYPGVYIEEVPSGVRTITGVPTSIAAFVGRASRGPVNVATTLNGFGDYERIFGGLWLASQMGYAVKDFFLNGGGQAIVVRLVGTVLTDDERTRAQKAADEVAAAAVGNDAAAAATAAAKKAEDFKVDPEKAAADKVASAAGAAAAASGATQPTVATAATDAAKTAVPKALADPIRHLDVGSIQLDAASPGIWGTQLRAAVDMNGIDADVAAAAGVAVDDLFNLTVTDRSPGGTTERFANLTVKESARRIDRVLLASSLVRWRGTLNPATQAKATAGVDALTKLENAVSDAQTALNAALIAGTDRTAADANLKKAKDDLATGTSDAIKAVTDEPALTAADFLPPQGRDLKKGLYALEQADLFNLLCIPPYATTDAIDYRADDIVISEAIAYCETRRAICLIDPPVEWTKTSDVVDGVKALPYARSRNAALYFPRLRQPNLLRGNRIESFAPCGAVAGVIARTDTQRGVWKAPAGLDATLAGVPALAVDLTDPEQGELNPLGVNCLRSFAIGGRVVWGARTMRGADQLADEWKYLPVRRTALYIEESLYRGTQWVVFEPNDEPLWAQIRLNVGAFLQGLFRQGAFQGASPREAYFVRCDRTTTPQADIDRGIVNIVVGFAPLKPAEFVVIRLQQIAGQIET